MTYALVDNASLTATQRVLGDIEIRTPDTIDGDIVALENLVQGILFYDELICIDDYKKDFAEERKRKFPFIRFLSPSEFDSTEIVNAAKKESSLIKPEIRGGEFADHDFREFLELLKMNIVCTWDMASSVYYLTMKMLGQPNTAEYEKYSRLSAAIFSELADAGETRGHWSTNADLVSSKGAVHNRQDMEQAKKDANRGFGGTTRALDMFVASLNWLAYKSIYYSLLAKHLHADTLLHPIRHKFQIHWMKKTGIYGHDFTSKLLTAMSQDLSTTVSTINDAGRASGVSIELPFFSGYFASREGDVSSILGAALALRSSPSITAIRESLREIRVSFDKQDVAATNKAIEKWEKELKKASASAKKEFGLKTDQGMPSTRVINVYNTLAAVTNLPKLPSYKFNIPVPEILMTNRSKGFASLYRDVTKELTTVERLGSLRTLLASKFAFEDRWEESHIRPKTEDPNFRRHSSYWKLPM